MSNYKAQIRKERLAKSVKMIKRRASKESVYYGGADARALAPFTWDIIIDNLGVRIIFTRDVGNHTGGWLKNPDYERCYHLSLSFRTANGKSLLPQNKRIAMELVDLFYSFDSRLLWVESASSRAGVLHDVWNYRLFADRNWQPIQHREEVCTKELTDKGWKCFSEIQGQKVLLATKPESYLHKKRRTRLMATIDIFGNWLRKIILMIKSKTLLKTPVWEYGTAGAMAGQATCRTHRRNKLTGEVQFILWDAGEQGHTKDYWYPTNSTWWPTFIAGEHLKCAQCKSPIHRNDDANICIECGGMNRRVDL
jgi:hypothetical protein